MTVEKQDIITTFVNTHIVKDKRDRTLHELTRKRASFIDKLNHRIPYLFKEHKLKKLENVSLAKIKSKLKITPNALCYIISHNELDDSITEFESAFHQLFGNGLGFCIVLINEKGIYLEGEQDVSAPLRYYSL